ncbi:MAG: leucine-rich repeat domain-containing protein [Muribaculaceae bacterium]|nr:leucine-rich repeat domain-containing protein [Muribaculaceae bacterium]
MRNLILSIIMAATTIMAQAVSVECSSGLLSQLVTNKSITALTVSGTMDARDFVFIADSLRTLRTLDLSRASITAHHSDKALFLNEFDYPSQAIPSGSLASMENLTTLRLPAEATTLGEAALAGCTRLTSVTLPSTLTIVGAYAFAGCSALQEVTLPAALATLADGAFAQCVALKKVNFGNGAGNLAIGDRAFYGCSNLTAISLPASTTSVGAEAFAATSLTTLQASSLSKWASMGDYAFAQTPLTHVELPTRLAQIGWGAFLYIKSLGSISLPRQLGSLPPYALAGAEGLTRLELGQTGIDSIGERALYNASQLATVTFPTTLTRVGSEAMGGNIGLQTITSNANVVPEAGHDVWAGVNQPAVTLKVPTSAMADYEAAPQWREFTIEAGSILGDVTGDGVVDVVDINAIINVLLGKNSASEYKNPADITGDGEVDVTDVNAAINILLGRVMASGNNIVIQAPRPETISIVADGGMRMQMKVRAGINVCPGLAPGHYTVSLCGRKHQVVIE